MFFNITILFNEMEKGIFNSHKMISYDHVEDFFFLEKLFVVVISDDEKIKHNANDIWQVIVKPDEY